MIILGITGSIGMGKSTAASMLQHLGIPVHDSDECVHKLLRHDSPAWGAFAAAFPYFSYPQIYGRTWSWKLWRGGFSPWWRSVNRRALGKLVFEDEAKRRKLESVLHPFVRRDQDTFIRSQKNLGREIVALDIPLLFETGAQTRVDYTVNITAPLFIQKERVFRRPNMSAEKFSAILVRQMPDGEKSARADFVIHSGLSRANMMKDLKKILCHVKMDKTNKKNTG